MGLLHSLRSTLAVALRRRRFEDGVSEELRFHIDAYAEDLVQGGMSPAEAARRARLELGGTEALREQLRAARGQRLLDELFQDLRYATRRMHRGRAPAVAAVLALGVGVNLAVFSVIHASLLRPLPHPAPDRLVSISSRNLDSGREHLTAPLDFFDFEQRGSSFARMAAYFGLGAIISLACTAACALVAGFEATRARDLSVVHSVRGSTPRRGRARAVLIGVEAALSLALLAGAALLARSFYALQFTNPGFEASVVVTTRLSVPQARYPAGPVLARFYDLAVERVKALPGVQGASVVDWLPASGFGASIPFRRADGTGSKSDTLAELRVVGLDYFRTVGIPVTAGRSFDRRDSEGAPPVIVINESLARAHFGLENPIGRLLRLDRGSPLNAEVIGVVGDVREIALRVPPGPGIYAPKTQQPWIRHETRDLVIRTSTDAATLAPGISAVLRDLEPDIPRVPVLPMTDVVAGALRRPGFYAAAVASFAFTAVLLAAFGIYGTVTSAVAERRRELGVRLALGASHGNVLLRAARSGAAPTLCGLAAGVPLALAAGRVVREQLYGIGPADWPTILAVAGFMTFVAVAAAVAPAVRATRIDPVEVLRHDAAS